MYNIGTDIVEIERIKNIINKYNDKFLNKVFSNSEIVYCKSRKYPHIHFAGKFSAKESIKKALSCKYHNKTFAYKDIQIINNKIGRPEVQCNLINSTFIDISISHTDSIAISFAILQND